MIATNLKSTITGFAVGVLINFMLMSGQFKNWSQPLIIMLVLTHAN